MRFERNGRCFFVTVMESTVSCVGGLMDENMGESPLTLSCARSKSQMAPTIGLWVILRRMIRVLRSLSAGMKSLRGLMKINGIKFYDSH